MFLSKVHAVSGTGDDFDAGFIEWVFLTCAVQLNGKGMISAVFVIVISDKI